MKQGRGQLTRRVADKSKELLGYEITLSELRLMPYVHYLTMNEQKVSHHKVNEDEIKILDMWVTKEFIGGDYFTKLNVTKNFYNALCEILYLSYVDIN